MCAPSERTYLFGDEHATGTAPSIEQVVLVTVCAVSQLKYAVVEVLHGGGALVSVTVGGATPGGGGGGGGEPGGSGGGGEPGSIAGGSADVIVHL